MNKLEMAHEYLIKMIGCPNIPAMNAEQISSAAFDLVDAMIAEHHKRNYQEVQDGSEWQPDWSQAPDGRVQYFAVDENSRGGWYINKPDLYHDHWYWADYEERVDNDCYDNAPSFNYQGDWRDSLRKRPK